MKIIVISSRFPFPFISGGVKRIISISKYLSEQGHELTLVSFAKKSEISKHHEDKSELDKIFKEIYLVKLNYFEIIKNLVFAAFTKTPFQVSIFKSKAMSRLLKSLTKDNEYDISIFHIIRIAQYQNMVKSKLKILEMTDSISLNMSRSRINTINPKNLIFKIIYFLEIPRMQIYEKNAICKFDKTILVSIKDKNHILDNDSRFSKKLDKKIHIIPLAVEINDNINNDILIDKNLMIFIGKMDYKPNEDAVIFFVNEIMTKIIKRKINIKFKIIGASPSIRVKNLEKQYPNIEVAGFVEDLSKEISKANLSVAPMVSGSGMQTKILESMALGVPVVTNTLGYGGLKFSKGKEIIVDDDCDDFSNSIIKIMESEQLRYSISKAAKKAIENSYSINAVMKDYIL